MKPFLILQLRPETDAADHEFGAFVRFGNLKKNQAVRIRMEKDGLPELILSDYSGVIAGGGPYNISDKLSKKSLAQRRMENGLFNLLDEIIEKDFPYLGACYGFGALAHRLGGKISKDNYSEGVGATLMSLTDEAPKDKLTKYLPANFLAFGGHKEACDEIPKSTVHLAGSADCPVQMIKVKNNVYATQFHPEADGSVFAKRIMIYKNAGYFPPKDAKALADIALKENVRVPKKILGRFTKRYLVSA